MGPAEPHLPLDHPTRSSVRSYFVAVITALFVVGCDSCEKKPEGAPDTGAPPPAQDAAPAAVMDAAAEGGAADAGASRMGNCPTAVTGAEVAVKDVDGGVEVSVTGPDEASTKEIRDRMKKIAEADKTDAGTTA